MAELLALHNVNVNAGGRTILRDVSLRVGAGERVAVLGANGAGKSTLLRVAHGLIPPTRGNRVFLPTAQLAMLFQRPPMLRTTALKHVMFSLQNVALTVSPEIAAKDALRACGLEGFASRYTRSLSGGEQQRLALACVWARRTQLLFADEPTAALDRHAVRDVERLLLEINANGAALVFTTHSLAQAKRLAQRIIFLDDGRVTDDGSANDFFDGTTSVSARAFLEGERI